MQGPRIALLRQNGWGGGEILTVNSHPISHPQSHPISDLSGIGDFLEGQLDTVIFYPKGHRGRDVTTTTRSLLRALIEIVIPRNFLGARFAFNFKRGKSSAAPN